MNILKNPILNIKTEALTLAVDLAITKDFLKVDFSDDDELITKMIKTATNQCETHINKTVVEKVYVYSLYELRNNTVVLPYSPIKSIDEIRNNDLNNVGSVLLVSDYILDDVGGILNFVNKPENFYRLDIEYTAGLTTVNDELIQALLMHVARMYEDRSGYSPIPTNSLNIYKKYKQIKL
ncbi:MAG: head-tail connector protein [Rickettsiales bacterium]|nr:head-tail connector protein [Rickettsiales bacterium]